MRRWIGTGWSIRRQANGDLGARLAAVFREAFQAGMERVVIIGTDCPRLTGLLIQSALEALVQCRLDLASSDTDPAKYGDCPRNSPIHYWG